MRRHALERWAHRAGRTGDIVVLDNRDSFVFNIVHRLGEVSDSEVVVVRSDEVSAEEIERWRPRAVILSPGPGHPRDAGCSVAVVERLRGRVPMLGICLGHQAIVEAYGGEVVSSGAPLHGESSLIVHDGRGLFEGSSAHEAIEVGRYHSLVAREPLPSELSLSAYLELEDGTRMVMGVRDAARKVYGVQFHPESVLSPQGKVMLERFLCQT